MEWIRPWGEDASDLRTGIETAAITAWLGKEGSAPIDYMPVKRKLDAAQEAKKPDTKSLKNKVLSWLHLG